MVHDPIVEEVWRVREELLKRYGGLHGLIKHLQAMDRARARRAKQKQRKQAVAIAGTKKRRANQPAANNGSRSANTAPRTRRRRPAKSA